MAEHETRVSISAVPVILEITPVGEELAEFEALPEETR